MTRAKAGPHRVRMVLPDVSAQLAAIVEHSNDAIFSRTLDGTISTWNAAAERMFGYTPAEVVGYSGRLLRPRWMRDEYRGLFARMRRGQAVEHFETVRLRKDGEPIHVSLTLSPMRDPLGRLIGFSTIARNITEQRQLSDALARRERELNDLFEQASVGLVLVSRDGIVLRSNQAFSAVIGRESKAIVGRALKTFHSDGPVLDRLFKRLLRRETLQSFPTEFCAADGELRFVIVDADVLWDSGRFIHSRWFVHDISRRRQLERELLEISGRERRSFAEELHDGLGQQLGGISYLCNVLRGQLAQRNAPEAPAAERVFSLVRKAIEQTRRLARGCSPIREEPDGLIEALRELAAQTSEVLGDRCRVCCTGSALLSDGVLSSNLYRIAQEAVSNAVKHGRPNAIKISLLCEQNRLTLAVADNGQGIGCLSPSRKGLGLRIMQHRAGLINGMLSVGPRRPRGTEVICTVSFPGGCAKGSHA